LVDQNILHKVDVRGRKIVRGKEAEIVDDGPVADFNLFLFMLFGVRESSGVNVDVVSRMVILLNSESSSGLSSISGVDTHFVYD